MHVFPRRRSSGLGLNNAGRHLQPDRRRFDEPVRQPRRHATRDADYDENQQAAAPSLEGDSLWASQRTSGSCHENKLKDARSIRQHSRSCTGPSPKRPYGRLSVVPIMVSAGSRVLPMGNKVEPLAPSTCLPRTAASKVPCQLAPRQPRLATMLEPSAYGESTAPQTRARPMRSANRLACTRSSIRRVPIAVPTRTWSRPGVR
jgi:hypothetical protein